MTAAAWLAVVLAAAPKVLIAEGDHEGVNATVMAELSSDVRARAGAAQLSPVGEEAACSTATRCAPLAERAGADAFVIVSVFKGPKGVTVDLDARKSDGSKLEVFTVNVPAPAHGLPDEAAKFFERIAKSLTPEEVALPAPRDSDPIVEAPAASTLRSRAWIPMLPGAAFAVGGAALLINAVVIDGQLRGSGDGLVTDPSLTRARVDSAVSAGKLSQGLGYAGLGLALACVAVTLVIYFLGGDSR